MTRKVTVILTEPQARILFEAVITGALEMEEGDPSDPLPTHKSETLSRAIAALVRAYGVDARGNRITGRP